MAEKLRAIEPVSMTTIDGVERRFLLTMGGLRRLKATLGVTKITEILEKDFVEASIPLLWEALLDKAELTQDSFADLLPANMVSITETMMRLIGVSMPEPAANPPQAAPDSGQPSIN